MLSFLYKLPYSCHIFAHDLVETRLQRRLFAYFFVTFRFASRLAASVVTSKCSYKTVKGGWQGQFKYVLIVSQPNI